MSIKQRLLPGLVAVTIALAGLPAVAVATDSDATSSTPPSATAESSASLETSEPATDDSTGDDSRSGETPDPSSSPDTSTAPTPAPALRSRTDGTPRAAADETSRVTVTIGTLTATGIEKGKTEYQMNETVADVVNMNISGKDYSLKNPYLRIRIPKTNKLADVKIVDSQAGTTERSSDEQYEYVTYRFTSLSGGVDSTYPYSFMIDGRYAKPGETFTVDATLYSADGTEIASDSKTYTPQAVGYTAYSQADTSFRTTDREKGHVNTRAVTVTDPTATVIPEGRPEQAALFLSISPDNGNKTNEGLVVPENVKMVVTLPATARIQFPAPSVTVKDLPDGRQELTFIESRPRFYQNYYSQNKYAAFGRLSRASETSTSLRDNLGILFSGSPLDTDLPVTIDYYVNAESDGTGGTKVDSRTEYFHFPRSLFRQTGNALAYKTGTIYRAHDVSYNSAYSTTEYGWHNEHIYAGTKDFTDPGLGYYAYFGNRNNGSGPTGEDQYRGGRTSSITEVITEKIHPQAHFSSFRLSSTVDSELRTNSDTRDIINANEKIVEEGINKGNTKLYGVRADGTRELIKEHVQLGDDIAITEQTEGEFTQLVLAFEKPVLFDNTRLSVRTFSKLTTAEQERLKASPTFDTFTLRENIAVALENGNFARDFGTVRIASLRPTVDQRQPRDVAVTYQTGGNPFTLQVGPTLPNSNNTSATTAYGPLTEIQNMETVTLLPDGVEYEGFTLDSRSAKTPTPTVKTVVNYHGTGKTAVIVDYGTLPVATYSLVTLKLRATATTTRGPNEIPTYMVWDGNDVASPATHPYTDALDLDEDGDTTEVFQVKTSTLTFTPPFELVLTKKATANGVTSSKVTGDLGSDLSYQLLVYNGALTSVKALTIVDVLPYVGDHVIAASAAGTYPERGSTFATGLTGSLEDANTPEVNEKFAFSYQLTPQGADLESVRDGAWVSADHVTDFSHVKSVRAVLKDGQEIPSKTDIALVIPSRMPTDTSLKDISVTGADKAVNTTAYSTDTKTFTEANSATVQIQKYHIKGRYFVDVNGDSSYTAGRDKPLAGRELHIVNDDGTLAKDPSGQVLPPVVTNADGTYDATIYATGTYRLKATKAQTEDFVTTPGTGVNGNNIDAATISKNTAKTTAATVNSSSPTQVRNVAIRLIPGTVTITKTSKAEDGAAAGPLAGAVFRLTDTADKRVTGTNGEVIQDVTTNTQGKATFTNVPLGAYKVVEITAPTGYARSATKHDVTLTRDAVNATLAVENALDRTSVQVTKVWNDANNQDGIRPSEVTITLKADGASAGKSVKLNAGNRWTATFEGLRAYTPQGTQIAYTVEETTVPDGYTSQVSGTAANGYTVTNTHEVAQRNIKVTKVWDDADNQDAVRPTSVTVKLLANGENTDKTATLTADGKWTTTFTGLDTNKAGKEIQYTVTEDQVDGYTPSYSGSMKDGLTVTNTHKVFTRNIAVTKVWEDAGDQDGVRPDSVTVKLRADGKDTDKTLTLTADGKWTGTFTGLETNKAGKEIQYTVTEDQVDGYTTAITGTAADGYTVTNTHKVAQRDIKVTKVWDDADNQDGIRPGSVTVKLLANKEETGKTLTLTADDKWTGTFTDLDTNKAGKEIQYTITEEPVEGYTPSYSGSMKDGLTLRNTHVPAVVDVPVSKVWVDNGNAKNLRPASVTVSLKADGTAVAGKSLTLNAGNQWTASFTGLAKFKAAGQLINYTVVEDAVDHYESVTSGTAATGFTVTNTITGQVSVSATKAWSGILPDHAPQVRLALLADGQVTQQQDVNAGNNWQHTFTGLPQYDGGREIVYTVGEVTDNGVVTTTGTLTAGGHDYTVAVTGQGHAFTVTNTLVNPTITVSGTVVWVDNNNQDGVRPATATVRLISNGTPTGAMIPVDANGDGTFSFTNLPTYDNHGNPITYTVSEDSIPEYGTEITGNATDGFVITNTHEVAKRDIVVSKVWDDAGNQDGVRPDSVTVKLVADGQETGKTLTLDAEGTWAGTFTGLDTNKAGKEIHYTVAEEAVEGYTAEYTGSMKDGLTVTNTHKVFTRDIKVSKVWEDADNQDGVRPTEVTVKLVADGQETGKTLTLTADGKWTGTFTGLETNKAGKEIQYTITEEAVAGYDAAITGSAGDGYTVTNTHKPATRDIAVSKVWEDADNQDAIRPDSVTIKLLANGVDTGKTLTLDAEGTWAGVFTGLDTNKAGKEIQYTITEDPVEGYTAEYTGSMTAGLTVTNTHKPATRDIVVSKVWEDADNKDGVRPETVTMRLYANNEPTTTSITLTKDTNWKGAFTNVDVNTAGKEIQYTVVEDPIKGYDTAVTGSAGDGYTVTNTLIHGHITLTKVSDTGTPLAGAVFELRRHDGHVADTQTTSKDGTLVFTRVAYGTYTVVETHAPKGYRNTTQVLSAQITTHGETVDLGTVVNKKIPTLAHTGTNTLITGTLGASLLVLGALLIQRRRRLED